MTPNQSFTKLVSEWKKEKDSSVKITTMAAYSLSLKKHIIPYFEKISDIAEKNIQEFVDFKLKEGLSVKSIKDLIVVLKMVINYGVKTGYLAQIPSLTLKFPKEYKIKEVEVFSLEQQKILFNHLIKEINFKNLGILICLNTGLRIGEICALKWKDIDLENGYLSVTKTLYRIYSDELDGKKTELLLGNPKTKHSYRVIPLPDSLIRIILNFKERRSPDNYVLTNSKKPVEPRNYRNYFVNLLHTLKIPEKKFHCLRHSFATRCIENDCDYKTVSAILGHADINTTLNLYVHPSQEKKRQCIEKINKSLMN